MGRRVRICVLVGLTATVALAAGCQSVMLSDDRIASSTAAIIGVAPGDLAISDRRSDVTNTTYIATTKGNKSYTCVINGGGLLAAGLVNPPICTPKQ